MSNKNSKFANFMNGKGFYAALALCLIGAGTAAWVAVDRTLGSITEPGPVSSQQSVTSSEADWNFAKPEEAGRTKSNVEMSSASSSRPQTSSSSSAPQAVSSAPSEQQALAPEQQILSFVLPVQSAEIFNAYSNGEMVKNTTLNKWCTHDGVDFKAAQGTPVLAVADGVVSRVFDNGVWGKTVEITHEGKLLSIYSGLAKEVSVKEGDAVTVSQAIGTVGETNIAESKLGSHLHFAMKQDGVFVDPVTSMDKR